MTAQQFHLTMTNLRDAAAYPLSSLLINSQSGELIFVFEGNGPQEMPEMLALMGAGKTMGPLSSIDERYTFSIGGLGTVLVTGEGLTVSKQGSLQFAIKWNS